MTRSRRFFASSPWIATGTPDYVNLGYTSRGLAKQALMRLSRKSLAIFRKLGLGGIEKRKQNYAKHSVVLLDVKKDRSVAAKQSPCCKRFTSMSRISGKIFSTRKPANL